MPEEEKGDDKVILKVDMHCEACKARVRKSLRDVPGLENIDINMKEQKVIVKGKLDVRKVLDRVKKKCGKRTELLFPQLTAKDEEKKEEEKREEPPEIIIVLKVKMHCGGCAREVKKALEKMDGVCEVKVDLEAEKVIVMGRNIDPSKIRDRVVKRTGKRVEIVSQLTKQINRNPDADEKKDGNKDEKKEEKQDEKKEEKQDEKQEEKKEANQEEKKEDNQEEKKEEKQEEKQEQIAEEKKDEKQEDKNEEPKDEKTEEAKVEEETKKEENEVDENVKKEETSDVKSDQKKSETTPMRSVLEYVYPPQLFSDENPNACSIM